MLKKDMTEKLNDQLNMELFSSLLYQQMSAWCVLPLTETA